jgi:hypothetical protein
LDPILVQKKSLLLPLTEEAEGASPWYTAASLHITAPMQLKQKIELHIPEAYNMQTCWNR